jgi:adenylate cyclase
LLEGSVRKAGGRVRISGQLVEADTGIHLWADHFDGALEDVFVLQDEVARSVVGAISPNVQKAEIARAHKKRTEDLTAYDLVLRALPHAWSLRPERSAIALSLFQEAIKRDPDYAHAYAMSAWALMFSKNSGWSSWRPDQDRLCVQFAREAIRLDSEDPAVLWAAGAALGSVAREHLYALELIERCIALDPNSSQAWAAKGWVLFWMGKDGISSLEKAIRLSPFDPLLFFNYAAIAECYHRIGEFETSLGWSLRAERASPDVIPFVQRLLAATYARLGRKEDAHRVVAGILADNPDFTVTSWLRITPQRGQHVEQLAEALRLAGLPE